MEHMMFVCDYIAMLLFALRLCPHSVSMQCRRSYISADELII